MAFPLWLSSKHENFPLYLRSDIKLVAVLTSFFDETRRDEHGLTCVGGYMFDEPGQRSFVDKWQEVLRPLRAKGITYFHAGPCFHKQDELRSKFSRLSDAEKLAFFGDLIQLVRATAMVGYVTSVKDEIFDEVMQRNKIQEFTGSPYTICALAGLSGLSEWADEKHIDGQIHYFFERGSKHWLEANHMMEAIKNNDELSTRYRYGGHSDHPKDELLPLQAADLLVWLWQKAVSDQQFGDFLPSLVKKSERGLVHLLEEMSDVQLNMVAMVNMFYDIKSNQKYP